MKMGTQQQHNNQDRYVNELVPPRTWTLLVQYGVLPKSLDTNYSFLYLLSLIMCERVEKNNCLGPSALCIKGSSNHIYF